MMHHHHHHNMEAGSTSIQHYLSPQQRQDNLVYPPPQPQPQPSPPPHLTAAAAAGSPNYPYPPIPGPSLLEPSPQQQQKLQLQPYQPQAQQQQQQALIGWANPDFNPPPPPFYPEMRQSWSTGLCDCCDDTNSCFLSCFCPCVVFGRIAELIDEGNTNCVSHCTIFSILSCLLYPSIYNAYLYGGQACCGMEGEALSVLAWYSAPFLYTCFFRQRMRRKYYLREAPLWDWVSHFFCMPCSLSQEYRELQTRGFLVSAGWEQNVENQSRGLSLAQVAPPMTYSGMTR